MEKLEKPEAWTWIIGIQVMDDICVDVDLQCMSMFVMSCIMWSLLGLSRQYWICAHRLSSILTICWSQLQEFDGHQNLELPRRQTSSETSHLWKHPVITTAHLGKVFSVFAFKTCHVCNWHRRSVQSAFDWCIVILHVVIVVIGIVIIVVIIIIIIIIIDIRHIFICTQNTSSAAIHTAMSNGCYISRFWKIEKRNFDWILLFTDMWSFERRVLAAGAVSGSRLFSECLDLSGTASFTRVALLEEQDTQEEATLWQESGGTVPVDGSRRWPGVDAHPAPLNDSWMMFQWQDSPSSFLSK